jgi:hypothetical protein
MLDNPYTAPCVADDDATQRQKPSAAIREWPFWIQAAHVIALTYPILLVGQFYASWLLAWVILGRQPRVSWDDPYETVGMPYVLGGLLVPCLFAAAGITLGSLIARFVRRDAPGWRSLALAILTVGIWIAALALLRWDPLRVCEWWID